MQSEINNKFKTCEKLKDIGLTDEEILQIATEDSFIESVIIFKNFLKRKLITIPSALEAVRMVKALKQEL